MRKRLLNVCIAAIIVFNIFGCARTTEDTPAAETETAETEYTKSENEEATEDEYAEIESIMSIHLFPMISTDRIRG